MWRRGGLGLHRCIFQFSQAGGMKMTAHWLHIQRWGERRGAHIVRTSTVCDGQGDHAWPQPELVSFAGTESIQGLEYAGMRGARAFSSHRCKRCYLILSLSCIPDNISHDVELKHTFQFLVTGFAIHFTPARNHRGSTLTTINSKEQKKVLFCIARNRGHHRLQALG